MKVRLSFTFLGPSPLFACPGNSKQIVYNSRRDSFLRERRDRTLLCHGQVQAPPAGDPGARGEALARAAKRLTQLDAATTIDDLRSPPSNRLEALGHDRKGQWSIRINDHWRVCFRFEDGDAHEVEIADYH